MRKTVIKILPSFYLFISLGLVIIPLKWFVAWMIAAFFHELFHVLFLRLFRYQIYFIEIGWTGARIVTDGRTGLNISLCALAGPLGGFALLLLLRVMPRLAVCGGMQALYNLLPVYPLDGGRALKGFVEHYLPVDAAKKTYLLIENVFLIIMAVSVLYLVVILRLGFYPVAFMGLLLIKNKKIPCKERHLRVQ